MQKKRIMISALALVVVALVASWGVNAYFNDTESSAGNNVKAGTMDLTINGEDDPVTAVITVGADGLVYPGFTDSVTITLANTGSINGLVKMQITALIPSAGTTPEPEPTPDAGELEENLDVTITCGTFTQTGKLSALTSEMNLGALAAGGSSTVTIIYSVATTVGNEIMDDSVSFTLLFTLDQDVGNEL